MGDQHQWEEFKEFQLTASQGGWPVHRNKPWPEWHFNSQPHKEADNIKLFRNLHQIISTHSLTRRLTGIQLFQSATIKNFNSQPHKEADRQLPIFRHRFRISTHSLTRRLTVPSALDILIPLHFNSQPHKEADEIAAKVYSAHIYFNSQPHKEADVWSPVSLQFLLPFQLTASQGGWRFRKVTWRWYLHFNSQPHKEADRPQTTSRGL